MDAKTRATSHPLYELLHDQPNDFTSSYELRRDLQIDVLLHGHGFAHLGRSRASGAIVELIRIPPTAVTLEEADDGSPLYFVTDRQGTPPADRPGRHAAHHRDRAALADQRLSPKRSVSRSRWRSTRRSCTATVPGQAAS